jgi:hypothetical protein
MPWPNQPADYGSGPRNDECDTGEHPNGDNTGVTNDANAADNVLSVTSHEHNESITDPLANAWWTDNRSSKFFGYENGDLCAWSWFYATNVAGTAFGPNGTTSSVGGGSMSVGSAWNQTINGHHYFLQGEWSNKSATTTVSDCQWIYNPGRRPVTRARPSRVGTGSKSAIDHGPHRYG